VSDRNTFAHFLHDAGLAAWFGGSLMGAIGVNGAAADVDDPRQAARVANSGWSRWTPFNAAAIAAHLTGGAMLLRANKGRVRRQKGVLANTNVKLALTAGALGATAYSRILGQKVMDAGDVPVAGGTASLPTTPPEVAKAQKQLKALQWAIPGLTGAVMASSALHEEQQRPAQVLRGSLQNLPSRAAGVAGTVGAIAGARAVSAAHAAGPALERAKAAAVPAIEHATAAATPALEKARDAASTAYEKALDKAKDTLPAY
jgi:hypothetical protein